MTKSEAVAIFGSVKELGTALGITQQAIYQWPEILENDKADRVIGAAVRSILDNWASSRRDASITAQRLLATLSGSTALGACEGSTVSERR